MRYKLILFDLDGTLLDTLDDLSQAVDHALRLRGLPLHTRDEYQLMVGDGVRNLVKRALPVSLQGDEAVIDAALADFKTYYTAHIDVYSRPYPGVSELLHQLHVHGVQLAVASNKFQEGTAHLISHFFPDIPFVAVLGQRPGFPLKPDPEIVGEVLRRAHVALTEVLMVGDSPTDMKTAANGGIDGMAVSWGYRPMTAVQGLRVADSVEDILNTVGISANNL